MQHGYGSILLHRSMRNAHDRQLQYIHLLLLGVQTYKTEFGTRLGQSHPAVVGLKVLVRV